MTAWNEHRGSVFPRHFASSDKTRKLRDVLEAPWLEGIPPMANPVDSVIAVQELSRCSIPDIHGHTQTQQRANSGGLNVTLAISYVFLEEDLLAQPF